MEKVSKLFIEELEQKVAPALTALTTLSLEEEHPNLWNPNPNPADQAYQNASWNAAFNKPVIY